MRHNPARGIRPVMPMSALRVERVRGRWRRSRQMDEKGRPDMRRGFSSFASQSTVQYPRQQSQQKINGSNEKIERVFVDESIKVFQSRRFQFECFYLPGLHGVLLMQQQLSPPVRCSGFQ